MQQRWVTAQGVALVVLALTAVSADRGVLLQDSPQAAVDALLDADRRASASAAAASNVVVGLMPMFTDDVVMPVPGNRFQPLLISVGEQIIYRLTKHLPTSIWERSVNHCCNYSREKPST